MVANGDESDLMGRLARERADEMGESCSRSREREGVARLSGSLALVMRVWLAVDRSARLVTRFCHVVLVV